MIADAQAHRFDIILCTKLDRFYRNVHDYYAVVDQLDGVEWKSTEEEYDTKTADGMFRLNMYLSMAQHEADRTGERIKATNAYRREHGLLLSGSMPTGYKNINHKPAIDPDKHDALAAFFATYLEGKSLAEACQAAVDHGFNMTAHLGTRILGNAEKYTGRIQNIQCEPYLTPEQAQYILKNRHQAPKRHKFRIFIFSGKVRCSCGAAFVGYHSSKKSKNTDEVWEYKSYRCKKKYDNFMDRCSAPAISERVLEGLVLDEIDNMLQDMKLQADKEKRSKIKKERKKLEKKRITLEGKKQRAYEAYIEGLVSKQDFETALAKIEADIESVDRELQVIYLPEKRTAELFPDNWRDAYNVLTLEEKRAFWAQTLEYVIVYPDKHVDLKLMI